MVKPVQGAKACFLLIILALCLLAACNLGQNAPAANNAQATVVALSTENARLMTAVAKQPGANARWCASCASSQRGNHCTSDGVYHFGGCANWFVVFHRARECCPHQRPRARTGTVAHCAG